jgi:hypothetical protein
LASHVNVSDVIMSFSWSSLANPVTPCICESAVDVVLMPWGDNWGNWTLLPPMCRPLFYRSDCGTGSCLFTSRCHVYSCVCRCFLHESTWIYTIYSDLLGSTYMIYSDLLGSTRIFKMGGDRRGPMQLRFVGASKRNVTHTGEGLEPSPRTPLPSPRQPKQAGVLRIR